MTTNDNTVLVIDIATNIVTETIPAPPASNGSMAIAITPDGASVYVGSVFGPNWVIENYPNPFNPSTTIGFRISDAGIVTLKIYDISGRLVKTLLNESRNAGNYNVTWDGSNQSGIKIGSGIYLYKLTAGNFQQVKKMMLIK